MSHRYETAAPDRYEILKRFARKNRKEMTVSETILWDALRHEIQGYKFRRQHTIGDYIEFTLNIFTEKGIMDIRKLVWNKITVFKTPDEDFLYYSNEKHSKLNFSLECFFMTDIIPYSTRALFCCYNFLL